MENHGLNLKDHTVRYEGAPFEQSGTGVGVSSYESSLYASGRACRDALQAVQGGELLLPKQWAQDRLIDYNHWAAGVGLFARMNNALDHRLHDHPDAAGVLISLLDMLSTLFIRYLKTCKATRVCDLGLSDI